MTPETRTIEIRAFRTPSSKPTCSLSRLTGDTCPWLHVRNFGLTEVCGPLARDLQRDDNGAGFLLPDEDCPLWKDELQK